MSSSWLFLRYALVRYSENFGNAYGKSVDSHAQFRRQVSRLRPHGINIYTESALA